VFVPEKVLNVLIHHKLIIVKDFKWQSWVRRASEDVDETESEVYMYVTDTPKDLLFGKGQLYVCIS
jgi:hypothetical protein